MMGFDVLYSIKGKRYECTFLSHSYVNLESRAKDCLQSLEKVPVTVWRVREKPLVTARQV